MNRLTVTLALVLALLVTGSASAADYTASISIHKTLNANVVDRITFTDVCSFFVVFNRHSTADTYVRLDGLDPVAEADGTMFVPAGEVRELITPIPTTPEIRLISGSSAPYSVECLR